jgi:nucleotide-binding universal stress UspA family protein
MELRKIIVGMDFSPAALAATHDAVELARHTGAELVLVHVGAVLDAPMVEGPEGALPQWEQVIRARLAEERRKLQELRDRLAGQGVDVSTCVIDGFADSGLAQAAKEIGAELIVIGSHGHTGLRRFLLGSNTERVVRQAECSVLVARQGARVVGGYHDLLVPTDFTPHAEDALRTALTLAARGAKIHLVHFWQLPPISSGFDSEMMATATDLAPLRDAVIGDAERNLRQLADRYRRDGVTIDTKLIEDSPSHGIAEHARTDEAGGHHHDIIILGSHGRRGIRRWLLGSVAERTVRHAPCSVLVVHRPPEAAPD